jgi:hypothetical protein
MEIPCFNVVYPRWFHHFKTEEELWEKITSLRHNRVLNLYID